jgi:hypothetical protein
MSMIDALAAAASVALSWGAGVLVVRALLARDERRRAALAIGYGYLVGAFGRRRWRDARDGIGTRSLDLPRAGRHPRGARSARRVARAKATRATPCAASKRMTATRNRACQRPLAVASLLIVVRLSGIAADAMVSPLPRIRRLGALGHQGRACGSRPARSRPFVSAETWLARGDPSLYNGRRTRGIRGTVPRLQVWDRLVPARLVRVVDQASLARRWRSPLRARSTRRRVCGGATAAVAAIATWLVMSLRRSRWAHRVAGAADLFLAAALGNGRDGDLALGAHARSAHGDARGRVAAAAAATIKVEGLIWLAALLAGVVTAVNRRAGYALAIVAVAAFAGYLIFGPEQYPLLGYVLLSRPVNVTGALVDHVFVFDNWHLAGYVLIALVAWRRRALFAPALAPATITVAAMVGVVVVVFYFSSAAGGVLDETLVNRFLLHAAPTLAFYALLLVVDALAPSTANASAPAMKPADA